MNHPASLVSVVIPVYNCESYLGESIQSVLDQVYRPIEVIVVDDGSTDGSPAVAQSFVTPELRYVYQPHSGLSAARNKGISHSQGSFLAFLDSDDLWLPRKLTLQLEAFHSDPELDMVFGQIEHFISPELAGKFDEHDRPLPGNFPGYSAGTMLIRKSSFFDESQMAKANCPLIFPRHSAPYSSYR